MKYWIIPPNPQRYRLDNALKGLNGVFDWRQHLLNHGLNGVPQGAFKVKEPLLSYLKEVFQ